MQRVRETTSRRIENSVSTCPAGNEKWEKREGTVKLFKLRR